MLEKRSQQDMPNLPAEDYLLSGTLELNTHPASPYQLGDPLELTMRPRNFYALDIPLTPRSRQSADYTLSGPLELKSPPSPVLPSILKGYQGPLTLRGVDNFLFGMPEPVKPEYRTLKNRVALATVGGISLAMAVPLSLAHAQTAGEGSGGENSQVEVVIDGDSLTQGRWESGGMQAAAAEDDINLQRSDVDYAVGRHLRENRSALERLTSQNPNPDYYVLALSTNDSLSDVQANAEPEVRRIAAATDADGTPATTIVLGVFSHTPDANAINNYWRNLAKELTSEGIPLVFVEGYENAGIELGSDGVHPRNYHQLVDADRRLLFPLLRGPAQGTISPPSQLSPDALASPSRQTDNSLFGRFIQPIIDASRDLLGVDTKPEPARYQINLASLQWPEPTAVAAPTEQPTTPNAGPSNTPAASLDLGSLEPEALLPETAAPVLQPASPASSGGNSLLSQAVSALPGTDGPEPANFQLDLGAVLANIEPESIAANAPATPALEEAVVAAEREADAPQANSPATRALSPAAASLIQLFTVDGNHIVQHDALMSYIDKNFAHADDPRFPDGYVRLPDRVDGLYEFNDSVSDPARFMAPETAAFIIEVAQENARLEQELNPGDIKLLRLFESAETNADHVEHANGGDIDIALPKNDAVREQLFMYIISLRNPDGSEVLHHIITGDSSLESEGDAYLREHGYDRPRILDQPSHGATPEGSHHWHASLDGGSSGPYLLDTVHTLGDNSPVHTRGGNGENSPEEPQTAPETPVDQPEATPDTPESPVISLDDIDWSQILHDRANRNNGNNGNNGQPPGLALDQQDLQEEFGDNPPATETPDVTIPETPALEATGWLQNIPEDTRALYVWAAGQSDCATVDMRAVAAEDWIENRGWSPPDTDWSQNRHSSADAAGRFQFIPETWFGRKGVDWDRAADPSAYANDAMARDGDGDGVRDPYNVYDEILAACVHNAGTAGLPIARGVEELSGDLDTALHDTVFDKGNDTLLGSIANYNGDGHTPSGVPLDEMSYSDQNPVYIRLAAALLLSDFSQAADVNNGDVEIIAP